MKRIFFLAAAALLAIACHEIPQDAHKSFAPKAESAGDRARFDKALAARARTQNEYIRLGDDKGF